VKRIYSPIKTQKSSQFNQEYASELKVSARNFADAPMSAREFSRETSQAHLGEDLRPIRPS